MKNLIIVLFLIFTSCKKQVSIENKTIIESELKVENGINKSVRDMWNSYTKSNPEFKDDKIPESEFFHNNKKDANRLAELTVNGKKKAFSGLLSLYKQYSVDLPKVGTKQIITDFNGKAKAIIKNIKVGTIPFNKISKEYAELDMGTAIEPLKKWKKAHWDFFESFLEENKEKLTQEMLIVCVTFETIWTEKN